MYVLGLYEIYMLGHAPFLNQPIRGLDSVGGGGDMSSRSKVRIFDTPPLSNVCTKFFMRS